LATKNAPQRGGNRSVPEDRELRVLDTERRRGHGRAIVDAHRHRDGHRDVGMRGVDVERAVGPDLDRNARSRDGQHHRQHQDDGDQVPGGVHDNEQQAAEIAIV
jgi:hypothetical protein